MRPQTRQSLSTTARARMSLASQSVTSLMTTRSRLLSTSLMLLSLDSGTDLAHHP